MIEQEIESEKKKKIMDILCVCVCMVDNDITIFWSFTWYDPLFQ